MPFHHMSIALQMLLEDYLTELVSEVALGLHEIMLHIKSLFYAR